MRIPEEPTILFEQVEKQVRRLQAVLKWYQSNELIDEVPDEELPEARSKIGEARSQLSGPLMVIAESRKGTGKTEALMDRNELEYNVRLLAHLQSKWVHENEPADVAALFDQQFEDRIASFIASMPKVDSELYDEAVEALNDLKASVDNLIKMTEAGGGFKKISRTAKVSATLARRAVKNCVLSAHMLEAKEWLHRIDETSPDYDPSDSNRTSFIQAIAAGYQPPPEDREFSRLDLSDRVNATRVYDWDLPPNERRQKAITKGHLKALTDLALFDYGENEDQARLLAGLQFDVAYPSSTEDRPRALKALHRVEVELGHPNAKCREGAR